MAVDAKDRRVGVVIPCGGIDQIGVGAGYFDLFCDNCNVFCDSLFAYTIPFQQG